MFQVTPGYDFGARETPRRATFLLQATGLTIKGIPRSSIAAELTPLDLNVPTTNNSTPSDFAVGALWTDMRGNLWGHDVKGVVMVRGIDGRRESLRFPVFNSGQRTPVGYWFSVKSSIAGSSTVSDVRFSPGGAGEYPGCCFCTMTVESGNTQPTYARMVLNGTVPIFNTGAITNTYHNRRKIVKTTYNSNPGYFMTSFPTLLGLACGEGLAPEIDEVVKLYGTALSTTSVARMWYHGLTLSGGL